MARAKFAVICAAALSAGNCITTCVARDVYVNNVIGDDRSLGRRPDVGAGGRAVRTIARALRLVDRGGRIILANTDQPYRELISLSDVHHRGYADQPLVIDGNGATLDGTVMAATGAWRFEQGDIFSMQPRRLTYQQLFLNGQPLRRATAGGESQSAPRLDPLEWALRGGRIYFRIEEGRLPEQYALSHCGLQTGITLYNVEHVRIEDLIIQGFQTDGVNAHELARGCELVRVESRANGRSGISVGGVSRVDIVDCNCYDNGRTQLRVEGLAHVRADGSDFDREETTVPWIEMRGRGRASINGTDYRANEVLREQWSRVTW